MVNKRIKQNRYKPETVSRDIPVPSAPVGKALFRRLPIILVLGIMSLGAILLHDAVVQSPFFTIRTVDISGLNRVLREEVIALAGLNLTGQQIPATLFDIRPAHIEKKLAAHPWVAHAKVRRHLFSKISIRLEEQTPLAIVAIENLADIIINTQGVPFKEYNPNTDGLQTLPVITGVDLSLSDKTYKFEGELFNSVMELLKIRGLGQVKTIHGDARIGILIQVPDIYNQRADTKFEKFKIFIPIKLGFDRFEEKLARAGQISQYMANQYSLKTIVAMDLYDIEKIFIKTEDTLHNTLEKGA